MTPLHREHPIRSAFLDPRPGGYHFGVDIAVDDRRPEPGAPRGRSHRVYAIDAGYARVRQIPRKSRSPSCTKRRLVVGHFAYWHVDPIVRDGEYVRAGQVIGWTCRGRWHVHLSEWAVVRGRRVWVNPLHAGGKLVPLRKTSAPSIRSVRFFTPESRAWTWLARVDTATPLQEDALSGLVELRVRVEDREHSSGPLSRRRPRFVALNPPYKLAVRIADASGRVVLSRVAFRSDRLPSAPAAVRYAPRTSPSPAQWQSSARRSHGGAELWYRPFSRKRLEYWDTRAVPDGVYSVAVTAWDIRGNRAVSVVPVVVANRNTGR